MSFYINNDSIGAGIVDYSNLINMEFAAVDLKSTQSQDKYSKGYVKIAYNGDPTPVTTTINDIKTIYNRTVNIYISKLIHDNIIGLTDTNTDPTKSINGEFIIENYNDVNGSKLYLCFLLQKDSVSPTNNSSTGILSKIFNNILFSGSDNSITNKVPNNKNGLIQISPINDSTIPYQNSCITYNDKDNNTIIVFTKPITYNNLKNNNTVIFDYLNNLKVLPDITKYPDTNNPLTNIISANNNNSINGNGNGNGNNDDLDNIYIDCNPTGAGEEDIKTYNLPIKSDLMNDIQKSSLSQLINNFAMFGVLLLISYIGIPKLYNITVCDKMNDQDQYYARMFILFYFIVIIFSLFVDGSNNSDMSEMLVGFFFIFLAILTYVLILDIGSSTENDFNITTFITFIIEVLKYTFFNYYRLSFMLIFSIILTITVCLVKVDDDRGIKQMYIESKQGLRTFLWILLLVIPTIIGLTSWIIEDT